MLILKIGNVYTDIEGDINNQSFDSDFIALRHKLSYRPEGYLFSPRYKSRQWDGWKRLAWKNSTRCYFPTGLLSLAKDFFKEKNIEYKILDCRKKPDKNIELECRTENYETRDYQERTIKTSIEKGRGIIMSATGSGKTFIGARLIKECGVKPFLFLVTSIDLLEQAQEGISDALIQNGSPLKVGKIGGGTVDIQDINIMTVQTAVRALGKKFIRFDSESGKDYISKSLLQKYKKEICELIYNAKGVIGDETQHWRSEMCQLVTNSMKSAYYKWGVSGTPYRDQGDDLLIQACFGKTICKITSSELIQKGYLVAPTITFVHINPPSSKFKNWQNIYKERIVEDDYYNTLISNITEEYIKSKKIILVLVQQIEHGKTLESMIGGSLFVHGSSPKKERLTAIKKLKNGFIKCIIATSLFDEGINCQPLNTLILAGQGRSATRAMQRVGRALRTFEGKTEANVIDFFVHEKYLEEHAKAREKMYRTEPEFKIKHLFVD